MRKKRKSDKYTTLILILILLAGLSLLLYPTFSEQWNAIQQNKLISGYDQQVQSMDTDYYNTHWAKANEYNKKLLSRSNQYSLTEALAEEYSECLNVSDNGIMGYLEIPAIGSLLAVYHGTDEAVLQTNVGHIEWTSLPVGGESTHSVLSGHRGLPSAELLTNIDRLEIGDVFYLHVLGEKLTYIVDDISVVLPNESEKLQIVEGKDYVTLLTCTPYGINSHRLLVRGERVNVDDDDTTEIYVPNEVSEMNKTLVVALSALLLFVIITLCWFMFHLFTTILRGRRNVNNEKKQKDN